MRVRVRVCILMNWEERCLVLSDCKDSCYDGDIYMSQNEAYKNALHILYIFFVLSNNLPHNVLIIIVGWKTWIQNISACQ